MTHAATQDRADLPMAGALMQIRRLAAPAAPAAQAAHNASAPASLAAQRSLDDAPDAAAAREGLRFEVIFSAGATVRRYDWMRDRMYDEVLVVEPGTVRTQRLESGVPLLDSHSAWGVAQVLGVCDQPQIQDGRGTAQVLMSRRADALGPALDVADGVLRHVSSGYIRHRIVMEPPAAEGGVWVYRVVDWEPLEISLVPVPADINAAVIRGQGQQAHAPQGDAPQRAAAQTLYPCIFELAAAHRGAGSTLTPTAGQADTPTRKDSCMTQLHEGGGQQTAATTTDLAQGQQAHPAAGAPAAAPQAAAHSADDVLQRSAAIAKLCAQHGHPQMAAELIGRGATLDDTRAALLDALSQRDQAAGGQRNFGSVHTVRDEGVTLRDGLGEALLHRVDPRAKLTELGRQHRGMSLLEMGRELLESSGVRTRGLSRLELAGQIIAYRSAGMHTTSDFTQLLANVASKRLRSSYEESPGTYMLWARQAPNAQDFKSINVVQIGAAPNLLPTNEHGEFKWGSLGEGAESYKVMTYGRTVGLSRQAIVNDDIGAFDRLVTLYAGSARRLENAMVYRELTANAALADGTALFHADHGNIITGAITAASLGAGRTAMRRQKGLQGEVLNLAPDYLIVPAALEAKAYEFTSTNYVPATKAEINEFRAGGRTSLEPVIEPILDDASATAWYLAASSGQVDTVEYCYLDGAEGPVLEQFQDHDYDGLTWRCRLDFGAKAIDHRGLVKSSGT